MKLMKTTNKDKRYPPSITNGIWLCILSLLYLHLGLLIVPILTIVAQLYFIYATKQWLKRYGGKRNFDMAHSLFHLGHPRWMTDAGITSYVASTYLAPVVMLVQSFWIDTDGSLSQTLQWWIVNSFAVGYLGVCKYQKA